MGYDEQGTAELRVLLARAQMEHEDYKIAIEALQAANADILLIQRFKKKKLSAKDEILRLQQLTTPDIIA